MGSPEQPGPDGIRESPDRGEHGTGDAAAGAGRADSGAGAPLDAARQRRLQLHDAMVALENVAAAPTGSGGWRDRVAAALDDLRGALRVHIEEVESPSGLLVAALDTAPRVAPLVDRLRADHKEIAPAADALAEHIAGSDPTLDSGAMRREVMSILGRLAEHRQKGADLVYEAYEVDIGGG